MKVTHGFVSFTEVEAGHHQSYNEWHLFDHLPEQFPLPGIVFGQRWVLTPQLRAHVRAVGALERTHYFTLYLMGEPIDDTLREFRDLAAALRARGRFHEHRISHLSGALGVTRVAAAPSALVDGAAVPYRPNRGVHVFLADGPIDLEEEPGVAGVWHFAGVPESPPELQDATLTVAWLDGDPELHAPALAVRSGDATFAATLAVVDPWGPWRWFD